jgi:hypothetical protein
MKGIYLSEEGKKEIENKIDELEDYTFATRDLYLEGSIKGHLYCLKEILSSATILPVEESWDDTIPDGTPWEDSSYTLSKKHPNGVIIQPK